MEPRLLGQTRMITSGSGQLRSASRRLRRQGYASQAGQMAAAAEMQRLQERQERGGSAIRSSEQEWAVTRAERAQAREAAAIASGFRRRGQEREDDRWVGEVREGDSEFSIDEVTDGPREDEVTDGPREDEVTTTRRREPSLTRLVFDPDTNEMVRADTREAATDNRVRTTQYYGPGFSEEEGVGRVRFVDEEEAAPMRRDRVEPVMGLPGTLRDMSLLGRERRPPTPEPDSSAPRTREQEEELEAARRRVVEERLRGVDAPSSGPIVDSPTPAYDSETDLRALAASREAADYERPQDDPAQVAAFEKVISGDMNLDEYNEIATRPMTGAELDRHRSNQLYGSPSTARLLRKAQEHMNTLTGGWREYGGSAHDFLFETGAEVTRGALRAVSSLQQMADDVGYAISRFASQTGARSSDEFTRQYHRERLPELRSAHEQRAGERNARLHAREQELDAVTPWVRERRARILAGETEVPMASRSPAGDVVVTAPETPTPPTSTPEIRALHHESEARARWALNDENDERLNRGLRPLHPSRNAEELSKIEENTGLRGDVLENAMEDIVSGNLGEVPESLMREVGDKAVIAFPEEKEKTQVASPKELKAGEWADAGTEEAPPGIAPRELNTANFGAFVGSTGRNDGMPYVVLDKEKGEIVFFDASGQKTHSTRALTGGQPGDVLTPEMMGQSIHETRTRPETQITPAGRFEGRTGRSRNYGESVRFLSKDQGSALAIHRVFTGRPGEQREARLRGEVEGTRVSLGCVNLLAKDASRVNDLFRDGGIVYILPETEEGLDSYEGFRYFSDPAVVSN